MRDACERFRRQLVAGDRIDDHSASCSECSAFARDWSRIEESLQSKANVSPPVGFAVRVGSGLPQQSHPVATMALRALPATLALLLAISIWVTVIDRAPGSENEAVSTDDYVAWILQDVAIAEDLE